MKRNLTKAFGAGVLTLSMALLPLTLPASAQSGTSDPGSNSTSNSTNSTYSGNRTADDRGMDWGWLGLFGLLGLAGLTGRKRADDPTRYRDPNAVNTGTYRE